MKNLKPLFLLLFFPVFGFAQSINGVYTGVLSNDSTTIRKDQSFEMALTEYNGKVYGYAYSTFIVHDTLYYIVKRVKGKIDGDICEVEDDEVITHNFPQKPEKKVFVTYTLRRNAADSIWRLDGNWKTNLVQKRKYGYYSISGKVETKEEKDLNKSKLYEHLGDLDLQKTLVLTKPKEKIPETKTTKLKDDKADVAKNTIRKDEKKNRDTRPVDKKPDDAVVKSDTKIPDNKTTTNPIVTQPGSNDKKDVAVTNTNTVEKKPEPVVVKADTKIADNKTNPVSSNPPIQNEKKDIAPPNPTIVDKKPENNIAKTDPRLPDNKTIPASTNNTQIQNVAKDVATNKNPNEKKDLPITTSINNNQQTKPQDTRANNVAINNPVKQDEKKTIPPVNPSVATKTETKIPDNKPNTIINIQQPQTEKKDIAATEKKSDNNFEFQELKRDRALKPAAKLVDGRETTPSETIYFKSDSLSIALYDNGEVDGDTVSVIINDVMFIEKQMLKSSAFRRTYYIPPADGDSLLIVLFADNLGKYPPNTGLLQIKDGEEIFYVRFKADLDRNAAIVLRRKYK